MKPAIRFGLSTNDRGLLWWRTVTQTSEVIMVEGGGFEPPKSLTTDLQSVPFGRSGIPPGEEALISQFVELAMGLEPATC